MTTAEQQIEHEGQTFVVSDSGEGPLVVLFHGFPDLPSGWDDTRAALNAAGYRTIAPYLRGYHPASIVEGRGYGPAETAQDAVALLDALGAQEAVLVGHDWGASVVYRAAELAPERVHATVTVAIPHPRQLKPSFGLLVKARHFVTLALPTGERLARARDFSYIDALIRCWAPNWSGPARDATFEHVRAAFRDPVVLTAALQWYRDNERTPVANLVRPALIVGGTTDLIAPQAFRDSTQNCEGASDVLIVGGAGHWPHREGAAEFHERLIAFLKSLDG